MARELNKNLFPPAKEELKVSLSDWKEMKKAILDVKLQLKQAEGGSLFVHSKMVKLFDQLQEHIKFIQAAQKTLELTTGQQIEQLEVKMESFSQLKEKEITEQVKNIIDKHQAINEKHSHQLQDLSQHVTLQSEQVWSLTDQLQEIKEEIISEKQPTQNT